MRHIYSICVVRILLLVLISITACGSDENPEPTVQVSLPATDTPTPKPTVALPTAAPTNTPAPPTPTATLTTANTPTRPATPTQNTLTTEQLYEVQLGDTLLGIAVSFDTTTEAIAAANAISEDDFLQIGQQLVIPPSEAIAAAVEQLTAQSRAQSSDTIPSATSTADVTGQTSAQSATGARPTAAVAPPQPAPTATVNSGPPPPAISHAAGINPLTGLPTDPASLQRRPLLVRIGNDVGARQSQAGFNSADVVYEEITEWWVTRFTAIFLSQTPNLVAPVRSARLVNVQLAPQYQGALGHSGGSDPVRWEISQAPIVNLDEYFSPRPYYYRENEGWQTRLAIDTQAARDYMTGQGTEAAVSIEGFVFAESIAKGEAAPNIYIPYPRATSFSQWSYDPGSGKYLRWINGAPLVDVSNGQVATANVIIYFAEHQPTDIVEDSNGATSIRIQINGQGPAWFFRDGKLNKGTWQTDGSRTPYFAYTDGSPYPLKPGNTWVEVVPTYYKIGLNSPDEANSRP